MPMLSAPSRRCRTAIGALTLILCAGPALAAAGQAPSLGELARQEQERRKALKGAGKVYSNKDLPRPPDAAASAPGALPPPVPAPADAKPAAKEGAPDAAGQKPAGEEKNEAWWRDRMTQAREAQRRGEAFAEALQSRINALSTEAVTRDDPYQRTKAAEDRQKAIAELGRVTAEIDQAKKEIIAIEEEARQAGAPPGWIR